MAPDGPMVAGDGSELSTNADYMGSSSKISQATPSVPDKAVNLRVQYELETPVLGRADDATPGTSLADYMTLPVSQFALIPMPAGAQLQVIDGGVEEEAQGPTCSLADRVRLFELLVPPLGFNFPLLPPLQLIPRVKLTVTPANRETGRPVTLYSYSCVLEGGAMADAFNSRFKIIVREEIGWRELGGYTVSGILMERSRDNGSESDVEDTEDCAEPDDCDFDADLLGRGSEGASSGEAILSWVDVSIVVDPPPPFSKLPPRILTATGNAVVGLALRSLMDSFSKELASDYVRWRSDPEYRSARIAVVGAMQQ